jgi:hypothetical protein
MTLQDATTHHALPVELLPFARRVLELSSHAGTLPPAELQGSLMRLAIDAIAQAEGAHAAKPNARSPGSHHSHRLRKGP